MSREIRDRDVACNVSGNTGPTELTPILLPHRGAFPPSKVFHNKIFSNCDVQPGLRNLDVELWDYASPRSQKLRHSTQAIARLLRPGLSLDSQFGTPSRPPRIH